jgi:hypothetical protein
LANHQTHRPQTVIGSLIALLLLGAIAPFPSVMRRLLAQKPFVDDLDEPFPAVQGTSCNVPNNGQVRLAVAELLNYSLRIGANGIFIRACMTFNV